MFTGLIQDVGNIRNIDRTGEVVRLSIHTRLPVEEFQPGESVAVDGICLTVVDKHSEVFKVEVSPETLSRTTLEEARPGRRVNLERALRFSDRLGGHLVTGHIDGMGHIQNKLMQSRHWDLRIGIPPALHSYLVEKGSVAIDGVSLTVNRCQEASFDLTLIPYTIQETTLAQKTVGDRVNVECDILGKYVEKFLLGRFSSGESNSNKISEEYLREHGFL
jgi:riboflavin synthase